MDIGVERTFSPQNFTMFPWEQVDDLWATKSEDVGLIVSKIINLCGHRLKPTSQTERQMDSRHVIARLHFALYK